MSNTGDFSIRKQTGRARVVSPLKKAFELYRMLRELRGVSADDGHHAHIRRVVGKLK
jgi:hypothetical protein